jgi:hypothetical protein
MLPYRGTLGQHKLVLRYNAASMQAAHGYSRLIHRLEICVKLRRPDEYMSDPTLPRQTEIPKPRRRRR